MWKKILRMSVLSSITALLALGAVTPRNKQR